MNEDMGGGVQVRFEDTYHVVAEEARADDDTNAKYVGSVNEPRTCRFCLRAEPEVTFKRKAHVIPTALGNRSLLSRDECKTCNDKGSQLEDDLCKYLALERAISRRWSRGGNKLKSLPAHSFVSGDARKNMVSVFSDYRDDKLRVEERGCNSIRLLVERPSFRPMAVAKSLCRIGLFLVNTHQEPWNTIRQWVRDEVTLEPMLQRGSVPGSGLSHTSVVVYRNRYCESDYPDVLVQLCYSTAVLLVAPVCKQDDPNDRVLLLPQPGIVRTLPPATVFRSRPLSILGDARHAAKEVWIDLKFQKRVLEAIAEES